MPTYRITIVCNGLTDREGSTAAADISEEFRARPWHRDVSCQWSEAQLVLCALNDYDPQGLALWDEFWDAIHACVNYSGTINVAVPHVEQQP